MMKASLGKITITMVFSCSYCSAMTLLLLLTFGEAFTNKAGINRQRTIAISPRRPSQTTSSSRILMVRNVDLPEAVVFYGLNSILQMDKEEQLLPGVSNILNECQDVETPVVVVVDEPKKNQEHTTTSILHEAILRNYPFVSIRSSSQHSSSARRALYQALKGTTIVPRSFGGSSGFGRRQWNEPERVVEFQHVVVLCSATNDDDSHPNCIDICRAARFLGMRVLCLEQSSTTVDNDLADAIVTSWEEIVSLEDIATPGSFWLNPPHPRDDDGNQVDFSMDDDDDDEGETSDGDSSSDSQDEPLTEASLPMGEDEMSRILADLDSL